MTSNPLALITGASSGIGFEFAVQLAAQSYDLILVARSEDALNLLAEKLHADHGVEVEVCTADLSAPNAAQYLAKKLGSRFQQIDMLINNAGFGLNGRFDQIDAASTSKMVQLNVNTLTDLAHIAANAMVKRGGGKIINVASVAAFQPCPNFAVYGATKAYVLSLSEAMQLELASQGVTVTALCPGATDTAFHDVAGTSNVLAMKLMDSAAKVARLGLAAASVGKSRVVTGFLNKGIPVAARLLPTFVVGKTAQLLFKR